MPDSTISGLPGATLPLSGSERVAMDQEGATVSAGAFVPGKSYQIASAGSTNFIAIGADSNTVGLIFKATGAGTGSGTAVAMTTVDATVADIAAAAPVQSVTLSAPGGWSASSSNTNGSVTLALGLPAGYSLPANTSQAQWDTAYSERARWDGGSTGLDAATARTSLQLGSAAQAESSAFATPAALSSGLAAKADLVGGVVPTSQIPSVALVQYLGSVASQAAMLALRGEGGDWCIRTDGQASEWVIVANNGATLSDWVQLPTGTPGVSSINGQVGAVTLGTGDVAESGGNQYFTGTRSIGALLTGFVAGAGVVASTDSVLDAIQKIVGNIAGRALSGLIGPSGLTISSGSLAGRSTAGTGALEEIAVASPLTLANGVLSASEVGGGSSSLVYAVSKLVTPFSGAPATGTANAANTISLIPISFERGGRVDEMHFRVQTPLAGSLFQAAIYGMNANGEPTGTPIGTTASISGAAAVNVFDTLATPYNVSASTPYYLAINVSAGTTLAFLGLAASNLYPWTVCGLAAIPNNVGPNVCFNYNTSHSFGTWPELTNAVFGVQSGASRTPIAFFKFGVFA